MTTAMRSELAMQEDDAPQTPRWIAANDNDATSDPATIDATLTRIAEAIGRHIAREHIRAGKAANDNEALPKKPRSPEP